MTVSRSLWPDLQERRLLGRFYMAQSVSEILNVIFPFRFVYLFLVMERPEWAVIPLMVEMATVLVMEIPTGIVADRWGRKISVICGGLVSALGWALIPVAVSATGSDQLLYASLSFFLSGFGQTLVSGAQQAWVVDNLASAGRRDLVDQYFARMRSFASLGGVMAGSIALVILLSIEVTRDVLDWLWYLAAFGLVLAIVLAATIPEQRPEPSDDEPRAPGLWQQTVTGFRFIGKKRPLLMLAIAIVIATLSGSVADEAFDIALITRGLDARALAPLGILDDLIGMVAPLFGVVLARRFGAMRLLAVFMILPAITVLIFFLKPGLGAVVALFLVLVFFDAIWDPVADAHMQSLIPSAQRATIGSMINQVSGVAMVAGIGLFALLLGDSSEAIQAATPDLITAFSGGVSTQVDLPTGLFGLPVPDMAILVFVLVGLGAVPFLLAGRVKPDGGAS